jgi:dethiobiotin synthetase
LSLPEDNNPISCVLILLGSIDVVVVPGVGGGGVPALLIYQGAEVMSKTSKSVIIVVQVGLYL